MIRRRPIATFAGLWLVALSSSSVSADELNGDPAAIVQAQPSFFIRGDVNKASRAYQEGESLRVSALSEVDAYLYILYKQADGKVFQIFPNAHQQDNKIKAKTRVEVPAADDEFRWRIGGPFGKEAIKVIASTEPIDPLNAPGLKQARFNPVSSGQLKDLAARMRQAEPAQWAEDIVEITTVDKNGKLPADPPKRVGLFVGIGEYRYNAEAKEAAQGKWQPNLENPPRGAKALARLLRDFGRLDDAKILLNEDATKKDIGEAITQWLPSVTRPGDTVFIFHGGHGGQTPDDNGDEPDGMDEYLLTHDYVDRSIIELLLERKKKGTLDDKYLAAMAQWSGVAKGAKNLAEIDDRLVRWSCISDDLYGHWLQRLAGRQVVVILDICHAAGFADKEKGFDKPDDRGKLADRGKPANFHFLFRESGRLKDIGQTDQALLAACSAAQESYALRLRDETLNKIKGFEDWQKEDLAVLSYFVCESIVNTSGPVKLEDTFKSCDSGMKEYFVKLAPLWIKNKWDPPMKPHAPFMVNYCTKPVWIKP